MMLVYTLQDPCQWWTNGDSLQAMDEEESEAYMFNQWLFSYCNTFYTIDDFVSYDCCD